MTESISVHQHFADSAQLLNECADLLAEPISADGQNINLVSAIKTAHERDMRVLAITGGSGGEVAGLLRDDDLWLNVPGDHPLRVLEAHQVTIHALCAQIDQLLLGGI